MPHVEPRDVLDDPRITLGPVDAGHGVEPDALAAGVDLQAEAVVLDFVHPAVGGRRALGAGRQAGIDECSRCKRGPLAGYAVTPRDHGGVIVCRRSNESPGSARKKPRLRSRARGLGKAPQALRPRANRELALAVPKAKPRLRGGTEAPVFGPGVGPDTGPVDKSKT